LIGGNGAGKSTLMKILSGVYISDSGNMRIDDQPVKFRHPSDAHARGIYLVPQEPQLFPYLTIRENILIGITSGVKIPEKKIRALMDVLGCDFTLDHIGADLTIAKQQLVELIRGLLRESRVIILDEPTSALTLRESEALFTTLKRLRVEKNICFVYITHRLNELFDIVDELTVLSNGEIISQGDIQAYDLKKVIQFMVPMVNDHDDINNRSNIEKKETRVSVAPKAPVNILQVDHLCGRGFFDVTLNLRQGEILGVTGVVGSGRTEFAEALIGIREIFEGSIKLTGYNYSAKNPQDAIEQGIAYLPEDRHLHGCFLDGSIKENISSSALHSLFGIFIKKKVEEKLARHYVDTLNIQTTGFDLLAKFLSGGNQQKVVFGKCLAIKPKIMILDEPTRGIDASARKEMYINIRRFARQGVSIILISSDFEEIESLSDRVVIMYQGRTVKELVKPDITLNNITFSSFGYRLSNHPEHAIESERHPASDL
jgi:AI-2 transport system ATP-binding protein